MSREDASVRPDVSAVFVRDELPRAGRLALWGPAVTGPDTVEMFHRWPGGVRKCHTPARLLSIEQALPLLLSPHEKSPSLRAWAAVTLAGLDLVARGRLLPAVTAGGLGAWRIGPLAEPDILRWRALAAAMPPEAYAVAVPHAWPPVRVPEPAALIRDFWDALADTLTRSGHDGPFSGHAATKVRGPLGWLRPDEAARTVLRVALPVADDAPYEVGVWLRSATDPSLLIEAVELWRAPPAVASRFGPAPETALLTALRRGTQIWPPLSGILGQPAPRPIEIADDSIAELLEATEPLSGAGIEVLLPAELLGEPLRLTAVVTPSPKQVKNPAFMLSELVHFRWKPSLGGEPLTEDELTQLADAKRSLVRLRGRWVKVDQEVLARIRRTARPLRGIGALAAALCGGLDVDGDWVDFEPTGSLAALHDALVDLPDVPVPATLSATLRPYQRRGLRWLAGLADLGLGGCLADDMGLGKTIQVIALHLHREGQGPTLVVCPTSLLGNWEREIARFAPTIPVRRFHGGGRHLDDLAKNEMVLVTYGVVRNDAARLANAQWALIVADEAQSVKNPLSRTARQLRTLPAAARMALTGTPVENRLSELWSLLDWTTPGLLGSLEHFTRTTAVPVERYRDAHAIDRLGRLIRPFLLRRRKSDPGIAPELPAKTETDRIVALHAEQATLYKALVSECLADIDRQTGIERRGLILKLLTGLKQICNHPAQYLHERGPIAGRSGKLEALDDLLDVILDEGESVLVFSQYTQMCRLLEAHLSARGITTLSLSGKTTDRDRMVVDFQAGKAAVFLISLRAGGVGLNLTRATHVVHYDRWWNPAVEDQATDRAYRIGQHRPVQVHRLITEGTVEDRIATLLADKRTLAASVIGTGEHWITEMSTADLADLVRLEPR